MLLTFSSCVKDEINLDDLVTNPLDPDYSGPAYISITNTSVDTNPDGSRSHVIEVTVSDAGFPAGTDYDLHVKELDSGNETVVMANTFNGNVFSFRNDFVTVGMGVDYCYEFSVWVNYSTARPESFCEIL